jgi:histidine triad (HIT) family protein
VLRAEASLEHDAKWWNFLPGYTKTMPSIFTQIVSGDIPCHKIYEDDKTFAFLDIHPITEGHTLVVPKTEVEFVWDLTDEDYQALMSTAKKVSRRLREVVGTPYVGSMVVGTDVPHAHIHLIPFDNPTQMRAAQDQSAEPDHNSLAELAKKLAF